MSKDIAQRAMAYLQSPPRNFAAGVRYQTGIFYLLMLLSPASSFGTLLLIAPTDTQCWLSTILLISQSWLSILLLVEAVKARFFLASSVSTNINNSHFQVSANSYRGQKQHSLESLPTAELKSPKNAFSTIRMRG